MPYNSNKHVETKYLFPAGQKEVVLDWLEHVYLRDPHFYSGIVSTIYYDTPDLCLYDEKRNGDFLKCKVRLRWYGDMHELHEDSDMKCFLEIKQKYGTLSQKRRIEIDIASKRLNDPFSDDEILGLPSRISEMGYTPPGILVPLLVVRYERKRYVDSDRSSRIATDFDICCTQSNKSFLPSTTPVHLSLGVMEIKGANHSIPMRFGFLNRYLKRSAFSKYAECVERLLEPLGRRR
jgi:hypothetical protein